MRSRVRVQEPRALQDVKHVVIDVVGNNVILLSRVAPFVILTKAIFSLLRFGGAAFSDVVVGSVLLRIQSVEGEEEGEEVVVDALVGDVHRLDVELGEVAAVSAASAQDHVAQKSREGQRLDV